MNVRYFFKNNKLLSIILLVTVSIFVIGFIGNKIIEYNIANWAEIADKQVSDTEKSITQIINYTEQKLILSKNRIADKLSQLENSDFGSFEQIISNENSNNLLIAIFDDKNNLKFWNDHYLDQITANDTAYHDFNETYFLHTDLNYYLVINDTLTIGEEKFILKVADIVEKGYQLNPAYFSKISLTEKISKKAGVDCKIYYSPKAPASKDGRKHSINILSNKGNKIGLLTFVKPAREKIISALENKISIIQSLFAFAGYLLIGILLFNEIKKHSNLLLKFSFISVYIIVLRYLLILFNLPKSVLSSELLSDKVYYSGFGYGLAASPLDLLITLLVFLIIFYLGFKYSLQYFKSTSNEKRMGVLKSLIVFFAMLFLYLLLLRGFGAAIRGFVFDTSLRYFQSTSLTFTMPHFIMHLNILLMGLLSVLSSITFIIIIISVVKFGEKNKSRILFFSMAIVFVAGMILYSYIQANPQITIPIKVIHIILVFASCYFIVTYQYSSLSKGILIFFTASFISIITLLNYYSELEKASLRTTANVIVRANEEWYKSLIKETIVSDLSITEAVHALSKQNSNYNASAFKIWSNSKLQKESINSSVNFISLEGELLGGFGSVYPELNIEKIIDTNNVIEEIQIFEEPLNNESQKLIRGIFPVKDHYSFLGYMDVSILLDLNDFGFNAHTELFSTGKLNEQAILKLDKLIILDYHNKILTSVYGELNPSIDLTQKILEAELSENNDAWLNVDFNGSDYIVYIKKINYTDMERVIAVALRNKELSISLFDFFKIFFTHSIILLSVVLIYFIFNFNKRKLYQFSLRTKLLVVFLIISLIPLILTAFYFRNLTEEKNNDAIYYKLGKRAFSIEDYLNQHLPGAEENAAVKFNEASKDLNINFSLFDNDRLIYSSSDLLYDVGLIPQIINPKAFKELILGNSQETLVKESIDKFEFNTFYYKATILDKQFIIKVSDGFNKILLPLSGSEVDVFLFGTYSLAVLLIIGISAFLANQISSPIRKITAATKSVAAGDLSLELKTNASGEVKELVAGFRYMIKELKKNQTIIAEIEREEAWKEMAKQVAHEIKNPLTPMKLSVQQLITAYDDKSDKFDNFFKKVTNTILNQIETLRNIATEFSNFARMPKLKVEEIDCIEIIKQSMNLFTNENITIDFRHNLRNCLINGDSEQLKRTIINLIRNSIQANATEIKFNLTEDDEYYNLIISDNGEGINPEDIEKIFEPNFTTKRDGMGLGLSMAKRYLRSTGADISVLSTSPGGTTIKITFPKK